MPYDYLQLPVKNLSENFFTQGSAEVELQKARGKGGKLAAQDVIPTLTALSEENQRLRASIDALQINSDTIANKFPLQGQDQNMQRSWVGFTFAANWANYSAAWACGYRRTSEGLVYLRGVARTAAGYAYGGAGSIIATLPTGFRPTGVTHAFPAMTYDAGYGYYTASIVYIDPAAGNIQIVGGLQSPGGGGSGAANSFLWLSTNFWVY